MHHVPEMSSVSLLIQLSSITPTLTPGRDDDGEEEKERLGRKNRQRRRRKRERKQVENDARTSCGQTDFCVCL